MKPLDPFAIPLDSMALIEASAGTGKTTTITTLVLRLLVESVPRIEIEHILVVTFTRAATAELRDRVRRRIVQALRAFGGEPTDDDTLRALVELQRQRGDAALAEGRARLGRALRDFDRAAIHTIHGFCQRSLVESAFESSARFDVELLEDVGPLLSEVVSDYWARTAYDAPALLTRALLKRAGPATLAKLAVQAVRHPRMPVLPDSVDEVPLDVAPVAAAMRTAGALWRDERARVLALLCSDVMKQNMYKPETIREKWAPALDAMWAEVPLALPDWFVKLTPAGLTDGVKKGQRPPAHAFFDACAEITDAHDLLGAAIDRGVLRAEQGLVDYARTQLARRKRETRTQSFDDLLLRFDDALRGPAGDDLARRIARGTKAALIDEFQDTDPVQYAIFRRIHQRTGMPLFLIGDPKQAIYGFRGADVFSYMDAARGGDVARHTLATNYRSDPSLVRAVNATFSQVRRPFVFREIVFEPVDPDPRLTDRIEGEAAPTAALTFLFAPCNDELAGGKAQINKGDGDAKLPRLIAAEIVRLLDSEILVDREPIRPRHVAVLCRTNNEARAVQAELRALRVPSVLDGDSSVFEAPMADEFAHVLAALAHASDARKVRAALATSIVGVDGAALYRMQQSTDDGEMELWLERFARWGAAWHERSFVHALHLFFHEARVQARLLAYTDGERRLTDLLHLTELLHGAVSQRRLGPLSLLHWYREMRTDPEARRALTGESAQIRLEHDEHAVRLTTIHKSKGLEYPIVFCPFLWANPFDDPHVLFHDRADGDCLKLDLGSTEAQAHERAARVEAIAEALRLCYVALTRAKHRCFVVWGRFKGSGESSLARLLHPVPEPDADDAVNREARLAELGSDGVRAALDALCAASDGAIGVRDLDFAPVAPLRARETPERAVAARVCRRDIVRWLRTASYTGLVRAAEVRGVPDDGADRDAHVPPLDATLTGTDATVGSSSIAEPLPLAGFPGGARSGLLLHAIFEHVDFRGANPGAIAGEARRWVARFGLDAERWSAPVAEAVSRTLATPLDASGLRLCDVARADRLDELEFMLPVGGADSPLVGSRLGAVLARHGAVPACPGYAERVAALGFEPLRGHLKGFVDLVFRQDGRFYVVDYKSNVLGTSADDYRTAKLAEAMREHHYPLQYLLYVVALHRHLSLRLPGYDYEQHFGGVRYLFVRGMSPTHAPGTGVYADRPSAALVADLSDLFAHAEFAPDATSAAGREASA